MDTDALLPLKHRWPADTITINQSDGVHLFSQLLRTSDQLNVYQDYLDINSQDAAAIRNFAAENGMTYSPEGVDLLARGNSNVPGWLGPRTNTNKPMFVHRCVGELNGYPVEMHLSYTLSSIQQREVGARNLDRKSVIAIRLPKVFPQIVLDSNLNESAGIRSYPTSFKLEQKQNLEGNFSKYFDLYAPSGLQVSTLSVLSPNFMQILIDDSRRFDVEFYGDKLYFIASDCIYDPEVMTTAMNAISTQLEYIDRLLLSWNYTPQQLPFDKLQTTYWQGPVTKIGPWRLTAAQTSIAILIGLSLFGLLVALLNTAN